MANLSPIYQSRRHYGIDTCIPQQQAIDAEKVEFHGWTHGHYPGDVLSKKFLPGLSSIGYWDAIGKQDWGLEPHRNEGVEIVLQETGKNSFAIGDSRHWLQAGSLTITKPWQLHSFGVPVLGPGRIHWLIFDVKIRRPTQEWKWPSWIMLTRDDLRELTRKLRRNDDPVWQATPEIIATFRAIADCLKSGSPANRESRMIVLLNALLVGILEMLRQQKAHENEMLVSKSHTVELFLKDLASNPRSLSEPWTLETMAQQCGMGVTTFIKYCRKQTNASPIIYLTRARLEWAQKRLRQEPETPVTQIAFETGFSSSQYFATQFRRRYGCAPRDCR